MNYIINRIKQLYFILIKKNWRPNLLPKSCTLIEKSQKILLTQPNNYLSIDNEWIPNKTWMNPKTNNISISKFKNVFVSADGIVFKGLKSYSESYVYSAFYKKFDSFYLLNIYKYSKQKKLNGPDNFLLIFDHWSKINYFHWMCDALPKLMILKKLSGNYTFKIIIPDGTPSYINDSLSSLGLVPFFFKSSEYLKISNLFHINYLAISGFSHPAINELIFNLKKNILQNKKRKKYYLSRNQTIKRSIANEHELITILERFGFETIQTENKTLNEQIELFSDCDILISPHGAGLTNMLFMPKGSKIIEIGHADVNRQPLCYWHLSNQLNHDYNYIPTYSDDNEIFTLNSKSFNLISDLLCC
jgi:hypothetical protein